VREGVSDRPVQGNSTLQEDFLANVTGPFNPGKVVGGDRVDEAGNDVVA
jgi:hypothetical protein